MIDVINGMSSPDISAKSLVSFGEMGAKAGEYLAKLHPAGSGKVKVAWFPGPPGAGWVEAGNTGFLDAVKGSDVEIVDTKYGDTGKEVQLKLVEDVLEANPDIAYIVGTSPTAEAAVGLLKDRGLTDKIKVLAYYFTPAGLSGHQGRLRSSRRRPNSAVIQGRIAIDQVVRILEGKDYVKHVGPALYVIDSKNVNDLRQGSLRWRRTTSSRPSAWSEPRATKHRRGRAMTVTGEPADAAAQAGSSGPAPTRRRYRSISRAWSRSTASISICGPGEVHVLFGENGAGKSTLISLVAGVHRPTAGRIAFRGETDRPDRRCIRPAQLGISAVFQEFSLVPQLTVEENLFLGAELTDNRFLDKRAMHAKAREIIDRLGFPLKPADARRLSVPRRAADGRDRQGLPLRAFGAHPGRADGVADRARDASGCSP